MGLDTVNSDDRGSISVLTGYMECDEITIFMTKADFARGGCIHRESEEHLCVMEGKIHYFYRLPNRKLPDAEVLEAGDSFSIDPCVPHYFISVEDSVVIEWGPKIEEKKEKYEEFRKIVDKHNAMRLNK